MISNTTALSWECHLLEKLPYEKISEKHTLITLDPCVNCLVLLSGGHGKINITVNSPISDFSELSHKLNFFCSASR